VCIQIKLFHGQEDIPRLRSAIGYRFEKLFLILGELSVGRVGRMGRGVEGRFVVVGIVQYPLVVWSSGNSKLEFTPSLPRPSLPTLLGLCLRLRIVISVILNLILLLLWFATIEWFEASNLAAFITYRLNLAYFVGFCPRSGSFSRLHSRELRPTAV